jgi:chemotaxis family two-component system response regulator PixG
MRFTGRLDIQNTESQQWSIYLYMGRIVWAMGGLHPIRRWYRYVTRHCPQVDLNTIAKLDIEESRCWDYYLLLNLAKQQQATVEQVASVIRNTIAEVLFDMIQQEETRPVTLSCYPEDVLDTSLAPLNAEQLLNETQQEWEAWRSLGLADYSPNLAPVLRRPEQLQQQANEKVYKTLTSVIDGKRTLRDLSVLMKHDLLPVMRLLIPFFRKGLIGLAQVPDRLPPLFLSSPKSGIAAPATPLIPATAPLIVCVDDSAREREIMEKILAQAGYRFLGIQDSIQALPILLEQKPALIFLDLVMPIANGYEICAQIRRVSALKETPIVILTGNDGIIDRVRAKVVGSSGFLSKPIDAAKVLPAIRKFLPVNTSKI